MKSRGTTIIDGIEYDLIPRIKKEQSVSEYTLRQIVEYKIESSIFNNNALFFTKQALNQPGFEITKIKINDIEWSIGDEFQSVYGSGKIANFTISEKEIMAWYNTTLSRAGINAELMTKSLEPKEYTLKSGKKVIEGYLVYWVDGLSRHIQVQKINSFHITTSVENSISETFATRHEAENWLKDYQESVRNNNPSISYTQLKEYVIEHEFPHHNINTKIISSLSLLNHFKPEVS